MWPAGTVIFREGDPSDYFYLITSGRVRRITRKAPEKYENLVSVEEELGTGDYFGTSAILGSGERKRHSTMIAVTDVRVVRLGRDEFEAGQVRAYSNERTVERERAAERHLPGTARVQRH